MARLHREILAVLLERIASGSQPAGELLPKEEALVEEFGVSRGVIRECMRALEERGVVLVRHGKGAIVQPPERWQVLDHAVSEAVQSARGGRRLMTEMLESRALVEPAVAALAAGRAKEHDLAALRSALDGVRESQTEAERRRAEQEFHGLLAVAAHNRPLACMLAPLLNVVYSGTAAPRDWARAADDLERLLDAVAREDADGASDAMRAHLDRVRR